MTTARPNAGSPIVKTVTVALSQEAAFNLFAARVHDWWPLPTHSVGGASSRDLRLDESGFVEVLADGSHCSWGEILIWDAPVHVRFTWHPGTPAGTDETEVSVRFTTVDAGTLVTLEHSGWDRLPDAADRHDNYDQGWTAVLARFVSAA